MKTPMILDIETYPNYNLFAFRKAGELHTFESWDTFSDKDIKKMKKLLAKNLIVTFNGSKYDMPLVNYALIKKATVKQMYEASKAIIEQKVGIFQLYGKMALHRADLLEVDHVDIIEPSPAVMISLKAYGARLGTKVLWDLPFDPHEPLTKKQAKEIKDYCENDLIVTQELFDAILPRIQLRVDMSEEYGIDLRSKSDAQIAEAVMVSELKKIGIKAERPSLSGDYRCTYKAPKYIKFKSPQLKELFKKIKGMSFGLQANGSVQIPPSLTAEILTIGKTDYKIGIGGLHSQEKSLTIEKKMQNADFASYYPFIMIKNGYYPKHLGKDFIQIYAHIVTTRLHAKHQMKVIKSLIKQGKGKLEELQADLAEQDNIQGSLKITINGLFGKLGSKWSKVYSPDLMLQVTITGQLTLLMLIEQFEAKGIHVASSNTDGLEYYGKKRHKAEKIIRKLEAQTGYEMEIGDYQGLYARDVNNYIAKYDGYVKAKGVYAESSLSKNSQTNIVFDAVREFINSGKAIKETIDECTDIKQFLSSRNVKGGGMFGNVIPEMYPEGWEAQLARPRGLTKKIQDEREKMEAHWVKDNGTYLGKVVRWYYSTKGSSIHYKSNGNRVPKSEGAMPMMTLTKKIPKDLDYEWYYAEANDVLLDLGVGLS